MKKVLIVLITSIAVFQFSCKKENEIIISEDNLSSDTTYLTKYIYLNNNLQYEFIYQDTVLNKVIYFNLNGNVDTFYIEKQQPVNNQKFWGNSLYEYNEEGKCIKITYYKSLPDSITGITELFYEVDNLSRIDFYGGDGEYSGNIIYKYDTNTNALSVLEPFINPNYINYWKYQPNHCIGQSSDVETEDGYAIFIYHYSYPQYPPQDIYVSELYNYDYTYDEKGLPMNAIFYMHSNPEDSDTLRFEYIEM
ncbi:MAG: hypothetical protein K8R54_12150 [Bacteroidales bacterium]|nr:hypothetical protein [Bacteroidales bacterium]